MSQAAAQLQSPEPVSQLLLQQSVLPLQVAPARPQPSLPQQPKVHAPVQHSEPNEQLKPSLVQLPVLPVEPPLVLVVVDQKPE